MHFHALAPGSSGPSGGRVTFAPGLAGATAQPVAAAPEQQIETDPKRAQTADSAEDQAWGGVSRLAFWLVQTQ